MKEIKIKLNNRDINPLEILMMYAIVNNLKFSISNIYNKGYLTHDNKLTLKGKEVINDVVMPDEEPSTTTTTDESMTFDEFVENYRLKFKGKKLGSMGDKEALKNKLSRFIANYNYSYEHMLNAIQLYINTCSNDKYKYLQQAHYTVYKKTGKEETSRLLTYCEELKEGSTIKDINESNDSDFTDML